MSGLRSADSRMVLPTYDMMDAAVDSWVVRCAVPSWTIRWKSQNEQKINDWDAV